MNSTPLRVLAFSGSLRKGSYNSSLARTALSFLANTPEIKTEYVDLQRFHLPLFNEDLEEEHSKLQEVIDWRNKLKSHDLFVIGSPEYNGSLSGALKNALDWGSRQFEGEKILECFEKKSALLISGSPGNLGGARGLPQLRLLLSQLSVFVYPDQMTVPRVHEVLEVQGETAEWKDKKQYAALEKLVAQAVLFAKQLSLH